MASGIGPAMLTCAGEARTTAPEMEDDEADVVADVAEGDAADMGSQGDSTDLDCPYMAKDTKASCAFDIVSAQGGSLGMMVGMGSG